MCFSFARHEIQKIGAGHFAPLCDINYLWWYYTASNVASGTVEDKCLLWVVASANYTGPRETTTNPTLVTTRTRLRTRFHALTRPCATSRRPEIGCEAKHVAFDILVGLALPDHGRAGEAAGAH